MSLFTLLAISFLLGFGGHFGWGAGKIISSFGSRLIDRIVNRFSR